jgi:hypothetical protein
MKISKGLIALSMALLIAACSNKYEQPAKDALASAEKSLTEARADAKEFAQEELAAAEDTYARMKAKFDKKEYKDVVSDTPTFNERMTALKDMVVVRQTQITTATKQWEESLSVEVPKRIEAVEARFKSLKPAKLPKDVTKEAYESAKASIENVKADWAAAQAAHAEGKAIEAAEKARAAEAKAQAVSEQLAMPPAPAA